MTFNPSAYALNAREMSEKLDQRREFEKDNEHLTIPFPVKGMEEIIPRQFPGETSIILARSFEGKSTFLKSWANHTQEFVTHQQRRAMTVYVSHEDTAEMTAEQQIRRKGGKRMQFEDDMLEYIGRSFGMKPEDIAEMYMSNIARVMDYIHSEKYADTMPFSAVFYDYIQRTPPDPERRKMTETGQRRLQIADDVVRLCNAAVTYRCPVIAGSQATLKGGYTIYNADMPIPGKGDTDEAKEVFQFPDRVYSLWQVSQTPGYYAGKKVDAGVFSFEMQENLVFMWVLKVRYYQPDPKYDRFAPIGKVFPMFIDNKGDYYYDALYHQKIYKGR